MVTNLKRSVVSCQTPWLWSKTFMKMLEKNSNKKEIILKKREITLTGVKKKIKIIQGCV